VLRLVLDEQEGGKAADSSGTGNDGEYRNSMSRCGSMSAPPAPGHAAAATHRHLTHSHSPSRRSVRREALPASTTAPAELPWTRAPPGVLGLGGSSAAVLVVAVAAGVAALLLRRRA